MVNEISSKLKFSSNYRIGSPQMRQCIAEVINDRIFQGLLKMYDRKDSVKIKELKTVYNKLIPERKKIKIRGAKPRFFGDCSGTFNVHSNKKNKTCGYSIDLATKDYKLPVYELVSLMHESLHYLDYLLNPKFIRAEENFENCKASKVINFVYNKFLYTQNVKDSFLGLLKIKNETNKALNGLSNKEKINILNYLRYSLMLENHAFTESIKYTDMLINAGKDYYINDDKYVRSFMFRRKIMLLEKMLANVIKKERINIRKNIQH